MTDTQRRNYNKSHYEKNRTAILENAKRRYRKRKDEELNVVPLFGEMNSKILTKPNEVPTLEKRKAFKTKPILEKSGCFALLILVSLMTYFLVTETANAYAALEGNLWEGYLKALILEGSVFSLCLFKARNKALAKAYKLFAILIYSYSVWIISSLIFQTALSQKSHLVVFEKTISELETEINKKIQLRDSSFEKTRITLGLRLDKEIEKLKFKLKNYRTIWRKAPQPISIWNTLFNLFTLRVLIMISNLLCIGELKKRFLVSFQPT